MENIKQTAAAQWLESVHTAHHLLLRVWQSPVLLAYLIVGTVVSFVQYGFLGICYALCNLVILGALAVLIRRMTEGKGAKPLPVRRPKIELIAGLAVYVFIVLLVSLSWNRTHIPVLQEGMNQFILVLKAQAGLLFGNGPLDWASVPIANACFTTVIETVPALLLFWVFGYVPHGIGLRPYWKLSLVLLVITALSGLFAMSYMPLYNEPLTQTLGLFLIGIFINGLPEELFFRGFLLPRLERALKNPVNALILSALLFYAFHIPSALAHGEGWKNAVLNVFSLMGPSGLLWGYLYQRTRSIVPGVLFHTGTLILGSYFFGL